LQVITASLKGLAQEADNISQGQMGPIHAGQGGG